MDATCVYVRRARIEITWVSHHCLHCKPILRLEMKRGADILNSSAFPFFFHVFIAFAWLKAINQVKRRRIQYS